MASRPAYSQGSNLKASVLGQSRHDGKRLNNLNLTRAPAMVADALHRRV